MRCRRRRSRSRKLRCFVPSYAHAILARLLTFQPDKPYDISSAMTARFHGACAQGAVHAGEFGASGGAAANSDHRRAPAFLAVGPKLLSVAVRSKARAFPLRRLFLDQEELHAAGLSARYRPNPRCEDGTRGSLVESRRSGR